MFTINERIWSIKPGGQWCDRHVLIFTEYRATQKWLHTLLTADGLGGADRLMTLYGGMDIDERERIKAAFQTDPAVSPVRILLATDAASEGIDLQNHCCRLIHYEIPWNPNRMEQRNGRLDRHGQRSNVLVYHFVGKGYDKHKAEPAVAPGDLDGDLEFLMRAVIKVENIREDLGKVGPVIASQVEEAMLGRRSALDTARAEREAQEPRNLLRFERDLREQVQKLYDQLQETKRILHLSPESIQAVVKVGLELAGKPPLEETELSGIWPDPTGNRKTCPVFRLPALDGSWALCSEGLAHPHTGKIRPITFDHTIAAGRDDVVLVHLNHRLVQMCLRLLRAEIWSRESQRRLHRVAARVVPNEALNGVAIIAYGRLVVLGGDSRRLHEELIASGRVTRDNKLVQMNQTEIRDVLNAATDIEPPERVKEQLVKLWPKVGDAMARALESRMRARTENLGSRLAERAQKEADDISAILRELERSIREQLSEPEPEQLELWTDPEREQLDRNRHSLAARLDDIPGEIQRECDAIKDRYANPTPRLFPAAVMFLVPERFTR